MASNEITHSRAMDSSSMQDTNLNTIIFDTETHALEGRVIEAAYIPMTLANGKASFKPSESFNQRYYPEAQIDIAAMAVHHILKQDLQGMPHYTKFTLSSDVEFIVGHNIDYDIRAIKRSGVEGPFKPICTLALARRYLPHAPAYNLAALSYYLSKDQAKVREVLKNAHSALTDVNLTAALMNHLIGVIPKEYKFNMQDLYMHSLECRIPVYMPFGEHKGKKIELVPDSYKQWLMKKGADDVFLQFALELDQANHYRRSFETKHNLIPGTHTDYEFIGSREPVTANIKEDLLNRLLEKSLELK